jgi:hypothetical protein
MVVAGGKERTAPEFRRLFGEAGFALEQDILTRSDHHLLIGRPI